VQLILSVEESRLSQTDRASAGEVDFVGDFSKNKKAQLTLINPRDAKACKIAPIRRVSLHVTKFNFSNFKLPMHSIARYV